MAFIGSMNAYSGNTGFAIIHTLEKPGGRFSDKTAEIKLADATIEKANG